LKASIAAAQAQVDSAESTVKSAEAAVNDTKLYAPVSGTIASLSGATPGQTVSAAGASSPSSSSSSAGSGSSGSGLAAAVAGSLGSSSSSPSSSSSSAFAEIINSSTMTMTVAFSESDITKVKVGQPATVAISALTGVELGAHVTSISPVGTSSNGVVSYNATLTLDQGNPQVRSGMSATATVIVDQAQGVTVPNQAISGGAATGTVTVLKNGRDTTQPVVVGLRGASRTQIISGVTAGEQLVVTITLPSLGTSTSTSTGSGTLGGGTGLFGGGGGFFGRGGGGGGGGGGLRALLGRGGG